MAKMAIRTFPGFRKKSSVMTVSRLLSVLTLHFLLIKMDTWLSLEWPELGRDHGWEFSPRPPGSLTFSRARRPHPPSLHFVWCLNASEHSGGAILQKVPFHEIYPRSVQYCFRGETWSFLFFMCLCCTLDLCLDEGGLWNSVCFWAELCFTLKNEIFLLKINGLRGRILLFSWLQVYFSFLQGVWEFSDETWLPSIVGWSVSACPVYL